MSKMTTEDFIKSAKLIHGDKYDYKLVFYINSVTKISIICKKHNEVFKQIPYSHTKGFGCKICGIEKITGTKEKFVESSRKKHGEKYDYNQVVYVNYNTKVKIFCNEHNDYFYQFPDNHTRGYSGCSKCKGNSISKSNRGTVEDCIIRAKAIHGEKYDYSEVEYINQLKKVKILCKKHKYYFYQNFANHLNGRGCPKCSESRGESSIAVFLDNLGVEYERQKKFETCKI